MRTELPVGGEKQLAWSRVADSMNKALELGDDDDKYTASQVYQKYMTIRKKQAPTGREREY